MNFYNIKYKIYLEKWGVKYVAGGIFGQVHCILKCKH